MTKYSIDRTKKKIISGSNGVQVEAFRIKYGDHDDSYGGFISSERNLSGNGLVSNDAAVIESAVVTDNARVGGTAVVMGASYICGNARVGGTEGYRSEGYEYEGNSIYALVKGKSKIGGEINIREAVVENSLIMGRGEVRSTQMEPYWGLDLGVLNCDLEGGCYIYGIYIIANIKTKRYVCFGSRAHVTNEKQYVYVEDDKYAVCVYREAIGELNFCLAGPFPCRTGRLRDLNSIIKQYNIGIDKILIDKAMAGVRDVLLKNWGCVKGGVSYDFEFVPAGESWGLNCYSRDGVAVMINGVEKGVVDASQMLGVAAKALEGVPKGIIKIAHKILVLRENMVKDDWSDEAGAFPCYCV